MSPSTTVRRAGVVTASALALSLGGAFTAGSASALTVCPVGQILSSTGQCVKKTVTSVTQPTPTQSSGSSSSSSGSGGLNVPLPTLPTGGSSGGSGSSSSGSSSGGSGGGGLSQVPVVGTVVGGLSGGSGSSGGLGGLGGSGGGISGPTIPGSTGTTTATNDGSSVPGSTPGAPSAGSSGGMLGPASAYLPTSGILGFTSFGGSGAATIPTSSSNLSAIPSPLLANQPASKLADVQAPLLAAGEDAGKGGTMLAAFGGYALPGLLVVLATAVVGVVGAGNIRVWQARIAARRAA